MRHSADVMRELKYITENRLSSSVNGLDMLNGMPGGKSTLPQFTPLFTDGDCTSMSNTGVTRSIPLAISLTTGKAILPQPMNSIGCSLLAAKISAQISPSVTIIRSIANAA